MATKLSSATKPESCLRCFQEYLQVVKSQHFRIYVDTTYNPDPIPIKQLQQNLQFEVYLYNEILPNKERQKIKHKCDVDSCLFEEA